MTVCVAAFCADSGSLILASDTMVTTVDMSADAAAIKIRPIANRWMAMYSGGRYFGCDANLAARPVTPDEFARFSYERFQDGFCGGIGS
jgi:hypothetical protein